MATLYVFPGRDLVPRVRRVRMLAQQRFADLLEAQSIDHFGELALHVEDRGWDEDFDPVRDDTGDTVPLYEAATDDYVVVARCGEAPGTVSIRGTWVNADPVPFDDPSRPTVADHTKVIREAEALGRCWAVETTRHAWAQFATAAVAGALAELTDGVVVSWDRGLLWERTPASPADLYRWWFDLRLDPDGDLRWSEMLDALRDGLFDCEDVEPLVEFVDLLESSVAPPDAVLATSGQAELAAAIRRLARGEPSPLADAMLVVGVRALVRLFDSFEAPE